MRSFGQKLRELRIDRGLTQTELSNQLSVGESTLSYYENDKREPDYNTLTKIADFFNVSIDYLLGKVDTKSPQNATLKTLQKPTIELAQRIEKLPEKERKMIETILNIAEETKNEQSVTAESK